ncbi:MAG TPA: hypothetical protein GXX35_01890 [Thermoanaerobacterales bacterium]|nr:hypothetical protein [Thermoanaerobacterales bacterium]
MDVNANAPGLAFAKEHGIPIFTNLEALMQNEMDIVLELTGHDEVLDNIRNIKDEKTHIIDSKAAKLALLLSEHQQTLNEKLKNYISHIETLMKHVGDNISEIYRTVEAINDISRKIINSVSDSLDSIKKTDQIIKLINDITARINILGVNASIESARAGEYGRGFSVVAQEIGKLTSSSKDATANITSIIETMKKHIENISEITGELDVICQQQTQVAVSLEEDNQKMKQIFIH